MAGNSRIEAARQRASTLKRVLAGVAAAGFVAAALLARTTHPGKATSGSSSSSGNGGSSSSGVTSSDDATSQDDSGAFSIAPSNSAPQAQTGVS